MRTLFRHQPPIDISKGSIIFPAHRHIFSTRCSSIPKIRCLFETYFTLDAEEAVKRSILVSLIAVGQRAAPGRGRLESLGSALMRKTTDSCDSSAAFFLSLVLPTVR